MKKEQEKKLIMKEEQQELATSEMKPTDLE